MRNFKELKIWQKGFQIAVNCFKITVAFPVQEKFGLVSQINRSVFLFHLILQKAAAEQATRITTGL